MPPVRANSAKSTRRPPPFKPPRPKAATAGTNASKAEPRKAVMPPNRPSFRASSTNLPPLGSSSSSSPSSPSSEAAFQSANIPTSLKSPSPTTKADGLPPIDDTDPPPRIPSKLLIRLLHENFSDPNTRIGKDAMSMVEKYMEVFVREAIARAAFERAARPRDDVGGRGVGGGILVDDAFLEVEDLEKLAPQLLLDF